MTQHRQPFLKAKPRGFTLIEVMITVAIIGILAAVAIPAYTDYVVRGRLSSAATGLSDMKARMEQHFQNNRTYQTGVTAPPCDPSMPESTRKFENFVVSCAPAAVTATTYTITAQGLAPVADFTFTINHQDVRTTTTSRTGYNSCGTKWLMKKGESCT